MKITKEIEWDMGHRVPNHKSLCRNPHGHRYKVHIVMEGDVIEEEGSSDEGMVIDFSDIKRIAKGFIDDYVDHGFMYYSGDETMAEFFQVWQYQGIKDLKNIEERKKRADSFRYMEVDFIPTAENIAKWLFDTLEPKFEDVYGTNLRLSKIILWETPTSFAEYEPNK